MKTYSKTRKATKPSQLARAFDTTKVLSTSVAGEAEGAPLHSNAGLEATTAATVIGHSQ
jgi:hypothetical protein